MCFLWKKYFILCFFVFYAISNICRKQNLFGGGGVNKFGRVLGGRVGIFFFFK